MCKRIVSDRYFVWEKRLDNKETMNRSAFITQTVKGDIYVWNTFGVKIGSITPDIMFHTFF